MYREQVPSYKHLDEPLDEDRFVFECILAGNLQAFTTVDSALMFKRLYCTFVWFSLFPWKFFFLLQNKLFIPSNSY